VTFVQYKVVIFHHHKSTNSCFFSFTTQSNYFVFKFPSVRLHYTVVLDDFSNQEIIHSLMSFSEKVHDMESKDRS
jgi:hypothetical protein